MICIGGSCLSQSFWSENPPDTHAVHAGVSVDLGFQHLQTYILNTMKRVNELRECYDTIMGSAHPPRIKRAMLAGVAGELRALAGAVRAQNAEGSLTSNLKSEQAETYYTVSQLSLNSNDLSLSSRILPSTAPHDREELESSILQKQRIKITLNEEIENYEDDYFHLQKILLTKREYHEDLDARIAKRSYEISKQSCQRSVPAEQERKSLTHRLKHFFLL